MPDVGSRITENLKTFGLVVKYGESYRIQDVTYLGQMPYLVGKAWYWGPTLGRRLYKCFWQINRQGHPISWVRGVASQCALFRHVPLLSDMAERVLALTPGKPTTKLEYDENRPWAFREKDMPPYGPETIEMLASRYNVPERFVYIDRALIKQIVRLPATVYFAFLMRAVTEDDL